MNSQALILDRTRPPLPSRSQSAARIATAPTRPGRWELANFVLAVVCILAAVIILSVKLAGAEPCFQTPSGKCETAAQSAAQGGQKLQGSDASGRGLAARTEAGLAL